MDKSARGRARGRVRHPEEGRAGGTPQQQQQQQPSAWGAGNPLRAAPPPTQSASSAWGPPSQQPQSSRAAAPAPAAGRAQIRPADEAGPSRQTQLVAAVGTGNVAESHSGRGGFRGDRPIPQPDAITRLVDTKQGVAGTAVTLQANYFTLEKRPEWVVFQYRVDFAPDVEDKRMKQKLFRTASAPLNLKWLFDGTVAYSPHRISPDPQEFVVDNPHNDAEKIRMVMRMVGELDISSYHYTQVYNLIMRICCLRHLGMQRVGRDFYDPGNAIPVPALHLELWPGMLTSIRQHERSVLMCAQIKDKVMKNDTALDLYMRELQNPRNNGQGDNKFRDKILNAIVLTEYNNKNYRIDDVDFNSSPASKFKRADGSEITFADYYRSRGIIIRNMSQPLLVSRSKERDLRSGAAEVIRLIPELCRVTGLTAEERANRAMMAQMAEHMRPTPQTRINSLRNFRARLQSSPACVTEFQQWDVGLSKDIISLTGRQLPTEELRCGDTNMNDKYSATAAADWTSNMRSRPLFRYGKLTSWAIIFYRKDEADVRSFYAHLRNAAKGMSWNIPVPVIHPMDAMNAQSYCRAVEEVHARQPDIKLFFVALPANRSGGPGDIYNTVKKKLTVEKGIPSQMVTRQTLGHRNAYSIATKVVVQMNCKVGGAPWSIKVPFKNWMVCGFDVCHDPKSRSKSYGAFVASYDRDVSAYYNTVQLHENGEELSNFIGLSLTKALSHYQKENMILPDKILIYRDGVGDGQINYIYDHELKIVNEALRRVYEPSGKKVGMRFIIVNKRINTRFFLKGGNPGPGTVVDDVVTLPDRTDFFLIPQCSRQGTVTPTYYNVLGPDEFGWDMNRTQVLTNRFCHQYYNWSGTVRVPAPCQYAHKLAFLAAQNLQRPPNENLNHLLHFL